ncbi:MAG: FtsX-like permease family protein [Chloroflexi bacterium]|nr:FtsX-like permease family protein [Chloroflexota bacterium]
MFRLALGNLTQNKARLLFSVGGTGLALTLVLFFGAVFAGASSRLTVYIDNAGADVWVSQEGVRTMHMSSSALPASVADEVESVPGVEQVVPILYAEDMVEAAGKQYITYVFGVPEGAPMGSPWRIVEGSAALAPGEVIIDRAIATQAGVGVGDGLMVLGQEMRITGLTAGTSSLASSVAFVRMEDFERVRGEGSVISFVLVKVEPGESAAAVSSRIAGSVGGVTVQTRDDFRSQERRLVKDMSADLINIMNIAGYLTGLAVVALTVYTATIARRREYGLLKAIGVRNSRLYQVVLVQALLSVAMGFVTGLAITLLLTAVIPRFNELIVLSLGVAPVLRVAGVSVVLAGVAALLPARQIAGLEPVAIIRRR